MFQGRYCAVQPSIKEQSTTAFMERMTVQTSLGYFLTEPTIGTKTSTILTEWNHVDFTGRTLHSMAQSMFRYGEKALAYAHGFLDSSKKEPFGKRIDDLLNHIMDEMLTEREQSMKLVEIYSLGHPIQRRQLLILLKWRLSVNISGALGNNSNNNYNNYIIKKKTRMTRITQQILLTNHYAPTA